ncbi:hypothetical protein HOLleu_34387 [Holothuria leucospilota]|uniref:Paraneoplastic antigen Ma-like C-terminal domain-containing protein n=1 Tax=Holothuria leucospilota TaxID=206669 RepID=A0A9Q0YL39_HOLLE|nr:hypothetical protein HOLleu_34387 [Holothuria leucospilota]
MDALTQFFRRAMGFQGIPQNKLSKFRGPPRRSGDPSLQEWLADFTEVVKAYNLSDRDQAKAMVEHLIRPAREEVMWLPPADREDTKKVIGCLKLCFALEESVKWLSSEFHNSFQGDTETLAEYSRSLLRLYGRMEAAAPTI